MATYQLNAADLLTLLASTVTASTEQNIIDALTAAGKMPSGSQTINVQTNEGPPDSSGVFDDTIASGIDLELITTSHSSTVPGANFPTPTVGPSMPSATYNFKSSGGVVIATGDQAVTINDVDGGSAADTLVSGAGYQHYSYTGPSTVLKAGSGNQTVAGGTSTSSHDTLVGGSGASYLQVSQGDNRLIGGTGANTLVGGSGNDTLLGGGSSSLIAGTGTSRLVGGTVSGSHDTLIGGIGNDTLLVKTGNNSLVGGSGLNTLKAGVGSDTLVGGGQSRLVAFGGNTTMFTSATGPGDTLIGGSGDDVMTAFRGDNRIVTGSGHNTITLGAGNDTVVAANSQGSLLVNIGSGNARIVDEFGAKASIVGGAGTANVVLGFKGDDTIVGGTGSIDITSLHSAGELVSNSSTAVGGLHTLTFSDGQTITINDVNSNITIHFAGGGTTAV